MLKKFLHPNKPYEALLKEIDAKNMLKKYTNDDFKITLSISQFYQLREELILKMYEKDKDLLMKRLYLLNDYKCQFGMF